MISERSLYAFIDSAPVGVLCDKNGIWSFQYHESWLQRQQRPLAPALPLQTAPIIDGSTERPVQGFFDNLLPEEMAKELMAKGAEIDVADRFALLAYYGAESAGAITLLPTNTPPLLQNLHHDLSFEELSRRIQNLPASPLTQEAPKRMSLAGAQHKLAVCFNPETNKVTEPVEGTASSYILKPNHSNPDTYPHSVINEWFIMSLAKKVGLNVPDAYYLKVPEPVYLIKRFDRESTASGLIRLHVIDGCQLLQLPPESKYFHCTSDNLKTISEMCFQKASTRRAIYNWMVFNYLTGNNDAHLKNISFFVLNNGFQLAPFYDLLNTSCYGATSTEWMKSTMVTPLEDVQYFGDVTVDILLQTGRYFNVGSEKNIKKDLLKLAESVKSEATNLYNELSETNEDKPEHLKLNDGEFQHLRKLIHGPIAEAANIINP